MVKTSAQHKDVFLLVQKAKSHQLCVPIMEFHTAGGHVAFRLSSEYLLSVPPIRGY